MRTFLINKWCTVVIYSSRRQLHYLVLDHAASFKTVEDNIRREFQKGTGSITIAVAILAVLYLLCLHCMHCNALQYTAFTIVLGHIGQYWAVRGCTGLYLAVLS